MKSKMTNRLPSFLDIERYGIGPEEVVHVYLKCKPEDIAPRTIITPLWGARPFEPHVETIETIVDDLVWELNYMGARITVIKSGMGAPQTGDIVLALGCTPCQILLFSGSAGGLVATMGIGDLLVAERSLCGDGFSRYLSSEVVPSDCFLDVVSPDSSLTTGLKRVASEACFQESITLHIGTIFCIDSILTQFFRLKCLRRSYGCIAIEMETAATFKAAGLVGIRAAALLQLSDVPPAKKSFFSGRTEAENQLRQNVKSRVLSKVILDLLVEESIVHESAHA